MMSNDDGGPHSAGAMFRWACPICGKSGMVEADSASDARDPLIRHLRYTDGDGHEPHNSIPESMSIHSLDDHIDQAT